MKPVMGIVSFFVKTQEEAMGTFSFSAEYLYLNTVSFAVISLTWFV